METDKEQNEKSWVEVVSKSDEYSRVENWYPQIKQWTYETNVISLHLNEALAIRKVREYLNMLTLLQEYEMRARGQLDSDNYKLLEEQVWKELKQEEKDLLEAVRVRLDEAIQPFVEKGGAAFVKLNTRSPKDAAFFSSKTKEYIKQEIELNAAGVVPGTEECNAEDINIFVRSITKALAVTSGSEALQLLTRSQRVLEDVTGAELMSSEEGFSLSLIVREWDPNLHPEWEFRVFVNNNRLTSATQYNPLCFVPQITENEAKVKQCIVDFIEMVKGAITESTYTIDLALSPEITVESTKIIEINAPPPLAGTGLFKWDIEADRKQIREGEHFELRVNHTFKANAKDEIQPALRRYIDYVRGVGPLEVVIKHTDLSCNECHVIPISKTWYECETCSNYDLCDSCVKISFHIQKTKHKFRQMGEKTPEISWFQQCSIV